MGKDVIKAPGSTTCKEEPVEEEPVEEVMEETNDAEEGVAEEV